MMINSKVVGYILLMKQMKEATSSVEREKIHGLLIRNWHNMNPHEQSLAKLFYKSQTFSFETPHSS